MAMGYSFELGAPATVEEVAAAMARVDVTRLAEADGGRFDGEGVYLDSAGFVITYASRRLPYLDPVEESFGFVPAVTVGFRLNKGWDMRRQDHDFVRLVAAVLTDVEGDAVFVFEGEYVELVRISGVLTVNTATDFWTPDLIALLPPHEFAEVDYR
jgi:hypothetical protein